jgi:uncharacterized protein YgiB involved in biofilm formation
MKRSRRVALTGLMASTALALSACGEEDIPVEAYATVEQCVTAGLFDRATCGEMIGQAMQVHQEAAPRYDSAQLCEEQFGPGQCTYQPVEMKPAVEGAAPAEGEQPAPAPQQQAGGGGGFFMPLFMGYMAGKMMGGGAGMPAAMQRNVGGTAYGVQPYYRTGDGRFTGVKGDPVNVGRNGASMPKSAFTGPLQTPRVADRTTVSRSGGFGATASGARAFGG